MSVKSNQHTAKLFVLVFLIFTVHVIYAEDQVMYAHYLNVGQADATLLEFPCGLVLIDAGSQDDDKTAYLQQYIQQRMTDNTALNNTLQTIIVTHNHIDHTRALKSVVESFKPLHYIDNGQLEGSGTANPKWIRKEVQSGHLTTHISSIADADIIALGDKTGLTNEHIDAIDCTGIDPQIRILSGRLDDNPGWSNEAFDNKNNHSLVIRVDFGEASFLFTGDLQEDAIGTLEEYYQGTPMLDVDVYQVGHHGSHNATTVELLNAMSPEIAVISMGFFEYGKGQRSKFTTWAYGHPRKDIVDMISSALTRKRAYPVQVAVATGAKKFQPYKVSKAIYGTGWYRKTIRVRATDKGKFIVKLVD